MTCTVTGRRETPVQQCFRHHIARPANPLFAAAHLVPSALPPHPPRSSDSGRQRQNTSGRALGGRRQAAALPTAVRRHCLRRPGGEWPEPLALPSSATACRTVGRVCSRHATGPSAAAAAVVVRTGASRPALALLRADGVAGEAGGGLGRRRRGAVPRHGQCQPCLGGFCRQLLQKRRRHLGQEVRSRCGQPRPLGRFRSEPLLGALDTVMAWAAALVVAVLRHSRCLQPARAARRLRVNRN